MTDIDVRKRQLCVIEVLNAESETTIRIQERQKNAHGDATVDASTVRTWVPLYKGQAEGHTPLVDEKQRGR